MKSPALPSPRTRMVQAALTLLETGGVEAVSTRAVSAAAEVQPPTIYRHFGDMQGLLNEVASTGFTAYLREKGARATLSDPVEQLREGWNLHVEFGLTHPHLYRLMYGAAQAGAGPSGSSWPAAQEGTAMLHQLLQRVAEAGRLAVSVDRAAAMVHGAALGVTLSLLSAPVKDPALPDLMLSAVLTAILTPDPAAVTGPALGPDSDSATPQAAAHAVSLVALLPNLKAPFSDAEQRLLTEWLHRLIS
ncbi:TetR/AcrR family transcriptional regulator [Deinococcus sp. Arct2-2]|uniref:TetR/AcrR family transcriptional regulator n=1 Tax=Deinococcus sp. Arct2-2 TaxID=2568653 RepID=UPI0010A3ECDF|nr:TetR/AcrR family transcriptional regulator [Deinococcus sp. Arct2-2]THF70844.1 TetR/AcrR family transcriptional regulator [Deinococcus sp. Arct2-2]